MPADSEPVAPPAPQTHHSQKFGLSREYLASALYVSLVLLAALIVIPQRDLANRVHAAYVMIGTAFGLSLAHWFAFRLASGITDENGHVDKDAAADAAAVITGGLTTGILAALPFLIAGGTHGWRISMFVLAALPAVAGAAIAKLRGWSTVWVLVTGTAVLIGALVVVSIKLLVTPH